MHSSRKGECINHKEVAMFDWTSQELDDYLSDVESMFNSIFSGVNTAVSKLPNELVSSTYPPCNIYEGKDGSIVLEAALAGWSLDEIKISTEDRHLIIKLEPSEEKTEFTKNTKFVQRGIRNSGGTTKYYIGDKFDSNRLTASYKDGILKVVIPRKEEMKPRDIKINV